MVLLLGCAVQCKNNVQHVEEIRSLDIDVQLDIKQWIQKVRFRHTTKAANALCYNIIHKVQRYIIIMKELTIMQSAIIQSVSIVLFSIDHGNG